MTIGSQSPAADLARLCSSANAFLALPPSAVQPAPNRQDVVITFETGVSYAGPVGAPIEHFVLRHWQDHPGVAAPMAVLLNGRLSELTRPMTGDMQAQIVDASQKDGSRVYRRSLTLLLLAAVERLFPDIEVAVEHVLDFGAYYCTVEGRASFTPDELTRIEAEMHALVQADLPITKRRVPVAEALAFFARSGDESKVNLLVDRQDDDLAIYTLDQVQNYFHGYMTPRTCYLPWFGLAPFGNGFVLRFPRRDNPTTLQPLDKDDVLIPIFQESNDWMRKMELRNLGSLNKAVRSGRMAEIVLISEALHDRRIAAMGNRINQRWREGQPVRAVFISGPSSSGKTTFSKRLGIQLLSHGLRPYAVSLDDFFVNRDETPRDEKGEYDFESVRALDVAHFKACLTQLVVGETVEMPRFNFVSGEREIGEQVKLADDMILIVEGLHGLNPLVASAVPHAQRFCIYVGVLTHLNLDQHNRLPPADVRLLRRIIRDSQHRGYTATETIERWDSVRRGEERYILPYKQHADAIFNSSLLYEISVLRPFVEPQLLQVDRDVPAYTEARRLLAVLQWVHSSEMDLVPDNSIIREFIGGSIFRHFDLLRRFTARP